MMADQRITTEYHSENKAILVELRDKLEKMRDRIYNGLGKEIREEVKEEIDKLSARLWALLSALFISLIAIVVTVLLSTGARSMENDRNYKAIINIGARLDTHLMQAVKP
jgi:hypothetical protein